MWRVRSRRCWSSATVCSSCCCCPTGFDETLERALEDADRGSGGSTAAKDVMKVSQALEDVAGESRDRGRSSGRMQGGCGGAGEGVDDGDDRDAKDDVMMTVIARIIIIMTA